MDAELLEIGKVYYYHWNVKKHGIGGEYNVTQREKVVAVSDVYEDYWGYDVMDVQYENGTIESVKIDDLHPYIHVWNLDEDQLEQLGSEIVFNSLYISDCCNSFDIWPEEVYSYMEGFVESLPEDGWEEMCTPENFAEYCMGVEAPTD